MIFKEEKECMCYHVLVLQFPTCLLASHLLQYVWWQLVSLQVSLCSVTKDLLQYVYE